MDIMQLQPLHYGELLLENYSLKDLWKEGGDLNYDDGGYLTCIFLF